MVTAFLSVDMKIHTFLFCEGGKRLNNAADYVTFFSCYRKGNLSNERKRFLQMFTFMNWFQLKIRHTDAEGTTLCNFLHVILKTIKFRKYFH